MGADGAEGICWKTGAPKGWAGLARLRRAFAIVNANAIQDIRATPTATMAIVSQILSSLAPTAPGGLPLTAQPVNEAYPQRYGMPSQPDSGDLATLSHPNQNVQLAHELATPEGNQTRLVSTDGVAHAYPAEEPAWQMPPAGSSD